MGTYKELLQILLTLNDHQLNSKIICIYNNEKILNNFNAEVLKQNFYKFQDIGGDEYFDCEDENIAEEDQNKLIMNKNNLVIKVAD